jgi:hypothetical protein
MTWGWSDGVAVLRQDHLMVGQGVSMIRDGYAWAMVSTKSLRGINAWEWASGLSKSSVGWPYLWHTRHRPE